MSNFTDFAREELDRAGLFDPYSDYEGALGEAVMELIEVFANQEHSGLSAQIVASIFLRLVEWMPLTPITSDPDEWVNVREASTEPLWQNRRRSTSFSRDGGQTWYDIQDESLNNGDTWPRDL